MQTSPSGTKSAPRLVSFKRVIRCDIGVSATGRLLQPYVREKHDCFRFSVYVFPSYVITPVISIAQPLRPSQHKCTTVTWNWVKKENILAHEILLGGVSVRFSCSKCTLQKK